MTDLEDVGPCRVVKMTRDAVLIQKDSDRWWIPLSQVDLYTRNHLEEGKELDEFEIARWFAEKEGIEWV